MCCSVPGCPCAASDSAIDSDFYIWRGYSLCEWCWSLAFEADHVPMGKVIDALGIFMSYTKNGVHEIDIEFGVPPYSDAWREVLARVQEGDKNKAEAVAKELANRLRVPVEQ